MKWLIRLALVFLGSHCVLAQDHCDVQAQRGIDVISISHPPELPLIIRNALPGEGWVLGRWRLTRAIPIYHSWESEPHVVSKLQAGSAVTALEGLIIIRRPDVVVVTAHIPDLRLEPGNEVLRYRSYGEGFADYWAKGCWYKELGVCVREASGAGCQAGIEANVTKPGRKTWWFKLQLADGTIGWSDDVDSLSLAEKTPVPK